MKTNTKDSYVQSGISVYPTEINDCLTKTFASSNLFSTMSLLENITKTEPLYYYKVNDGNLEENLIFKDIELDYLSFIEVDSSKDVILVLFGNEDYDTLIHIFTKLSKRIHTIIYVKDKSFQQFLSDNSTNTLKTDSINQAVNESYKIAQDGQIIVLPDPGCNFDFFSHIYFS